MDKRHWTFAVALLTASFAGTVRAEPSDPLAALPIQVETLANGLRVVMNRDTSVPTVAVAVYYDVGSRNEERGRSGFAHLFEHMMFQGSSSVGKGEHFQLIMNRGGSPNGTTSADRTNYYQTVPSSELELALFLEADRMRSLAVTQENFENQRQVVMEERRQSYSNQPYALSYLRINELAYGDYWPYAHSTIGDMGDLKRAPIADVKKFFRDYYPPNNAVVSIAGDFDPKTAMALVNKYFGGIDRRPVPPYRPGKRRPQTKERVESMVDAIAELPAFHLAYPIPKSRAQDHYPLEMLAIVLGDGRSSRLYQALVKERELAQSVHVNTDDRRGPDLFSFWVVMSDGKSIPDAKELIFAELRRIADDGITEKELQKAKNRVKAAFVFGLESNMARAMQLGRYHLYWGSAHKLKEEPGRYLAVTADDVKRVAGKYFAPTNRTVLDVIPTNVEKEGKP